MLESFISIVCMYILEKCAMGLVVFMEMFVFIEKDVLLDRKGSPHATFHLNHVKRQISSTEFD